jgi:hypothetical protein
VDVLPSFCSSLEDAYAKEVTASGGSATGLVDPKNVPVCELRQLTPHANPADFVGGSCAQAASDKGWCYVTGTAAGLCPSAVVFAGKDSWPTGATSNLECVSPGVGTLTAPGVDASTD